MKPSAKRLCDIRLPDASFPLSVAVEDLGSVACGAEEYGALFDRLRPAYVSLTWNGDNPLGGGCGFESPLTETGKQAIGTLAAHSVPLDLSHLSDKAFYSALDVADKTRARILVSHTAARALCRHPRNLTDGMVKEIAARKGIIGVAAVPNFLDGGLSYGENCGIVRYVDHIEHLCSVIGADGVAIGTDYLGTEYAPEGLEDYSGFYGVAEELAKRGFRNEDINKIFYENAEKFMR